MNQYDAQSVADMLRRLGWRPADQGESADLVLIQTCCVTATAMRKSRQAIRRAVRNHTRPDGPAVCVLGCYGAYHEEKIHQLLAEAGIDRSRAFVAPSDADPAAVVRRIANAHAKSVRGGAPAPPRSSTKRDAAGAAPHMDQAGLYDRRTVLHKTQPPAESQSASARKVENLKQRRSEAIRGGQPGTRNLEAIDRFAGHQRAFVKVQDGCDAFCSYCIVPYTRPHVWSRPAGEVLDECHRLIDAGHRELVLCGVFLGAYSRETAIRRRWSNADRSPLAELLLRVAELDGLWRVRLSSLEPGDLTDDLLDAIAHPAVAPHLHLPLQSGSDAILRRMNRQYDSGQFRRTADRLRAALDRPALTTDIIVGFPGETEADFRATLDVARHAGFAKIHAFPFSAIQPTLAWRRRHEAPPANVARDRLDRLATLEADLADAYRRQFIGQTLQALVERTGVDGPRRAMTDRYLTATFAGPDDLTGRLVNLRVAAATPAGLAADLL